MMKDANYYHVRQLQRRPFERSVYTKDYFIEKKSELELATIIVSVLKDDIRESLRNYLSDEPKYVPNLHTRMTTPAALHDEERKFKKQNALYKTIDKIIETGQTPKENPHNKNLANMPDFNFLRLTPERIAVLEEAGITLEKLMQHGTITISAKKYKEEYRKEFPSEVGAIRVNNVVFINGSEYREKHEAERMKESGELRKTHQEKLLEKRKPEDVKDPMLEMAKTLENQARSLRLKARIKDIKQTESEGIKR